jgi:siderophore synthetase component
MKLRTRKRTQQREHSRLLAAQRRQKTKDAAGLRAQHDLCLCGDDERFYPTDSESEADNAPMKICENPACGKRRLIVKIVADDERALTPELLAAVPGLIKNYVR